MAHVKAPTHEDKGLRWQVTISLFFSWLCHSVSGQIHYSIVEEMRKDSVIANIADDLGLDIKQLSSRKLRIVSRTAEKYFNVDNGSLYIKDRIDRETMCGTEDLCYLTFDAVVENHLTVFRVRVEIQDINDNPPTFVPDVFTLETIELTSPGTRFALRNAEDPDIGSNSVQSYKLSDNQYFTLSEDRNLDGSTFLELVLEKPLDREKQNIHKLTLTAMDGGSPEKSGTALIKIIVTDVNDNFPIFTQSVYKVSVNENIPVNSTIITLAANDKDEGLYSEIAYSFSKTSGYIHHTGTFSVHPISGEIKAINWLDFELLRNYELSLQAKDGGGLVAHCKVLIEVIDVNDNSPEISITSLSTPVPEDAATGTVIALIEVHDQDSGENGEVDCKLTEDSSFKSEVVYAQRTFDYEQLKEFDIEVTARDNGLPILSSNTTLLIRIVDQNDNMPKILYPSSDGGSTVFEMVPFASEPGSLVTKVVAVDSDSGHNAWLSYHFIQSSEPSHFFINEHTGEIRTAHAFQEKDISKHRFVVMVKDNGDPTLSATVTLSLIVADNFQQVVPNLSTISDIGEELSHNSLQMYLLIALALISFLFIITLMRVVISKCRKSKSTSFGSLSTNLYPPLDPRVLSMYSDGTLHLPYSYNVCVALDPSESDYAVPQSNQNIPVDNLIDANESGQSIEEARSKNYKIMKTITLLTLLKEFQTKSKAIKVLYDIVDESIMSTVKGTSSKRKDGFIIVVDRNSLEQ
ncbi:protocadherin gamma-B2-like [Engystomops pustulosus]|uniref:protocadherin gamma-B2-like n=1 Tax=Engystomops pustulosus TaxID=76066 RepID=UPI003AFA775A